MCDGGFFIMAGINHFRNLSMLAGFAAANGVATSRPAAVVSGLLILVGDLSVVNFQKNLALLGTALLLLSISQPWPRSLS